jgi:hypothetical protein
MDGALPRLQVFATALIYVGIFLVRRSLPALAYFLKVKDCQTSRPIAPTHLRRCSGRWL